MPPLSLRRSCAACAKAKHSCDLRTPQCSRCQKRSVQCTYTNAPLTTTTTTTSSPTSTTADPLALTRPSSSNQNSPRAVLLDFSLGTACDPFETYPHIRLPRNVVQRLIDRFLSKIAFTYYPLDRNASSNPFITSWWPRALADPALFHVSLQTASLDEELMAQNGFPISQVLMTDSVSLVRRKVIDSVQATQDETINAVVTLAAIEHGKGNYSVSLMHIEGIKRMVDLRGGINSVMRVNPLTARMVAWVALLVTGSPQFPTQDDESLENTDVGLAPTTAWKQLSRTNSTDVVPSPGPSSTTANSEPSIDDIFCKLRRMFHRPVDQCPTGSELHDLTCFVIHRLLSLPSANPQDLPNSQDPAPPPECLRYGLAVYMFLLHGHAFYPHAEILYSLVVRLRRNLELFAALVGNNADISLAIWLLSTGMVAAAATPEWDWYAEHAVQVAQAYDALSWPRILEHIQRVLWYPSEYYVGAYQTAWQQALATKGSSMDTG